MARILILTPQLPVPPQALTGTSQGTTIRNYSLIAGLAKRHEIDLVSFIASDDPNRPATAADQRALDLLHTHCRQIITAPQPRRTTLARGRDTFLSPLPDMALRLESKTLRHQMALLANKQTRDYDIIQIEGIEMASYALPVGPRRASSGNAPPRLVFDDHNAEYLLQQRAFLTDVRQPRRWLAAAYSFVQWRKLAAYERRICRTADHVVAVSEADRAALQRLIPELEVVVVPNGVDLTFLRPGVLPPQPGMASPALVFTGKMDYRPNVDGVLWFVEAVLPLVQAHIPDVHFYVVGQQPHARLTALTGHPAVTLTGRVPDVRPYIAGASVYVVPLRIGGGTRLKVLEAMALGQAVVSTHLGCDGFPFVDGQEVVFADEPAAFADAVRHLLHDRARAAALGRTARSYVENHYGWDAIVPRLEALYR